MEQCKIFHIIVNKGVMEYYFDKRQLIRLYNIMRNIEQGNEEILRNFITVIGQTNRKMVNCKRTEV